MRLTRKKSLAAIGAVALAVSLTACSGGDAGGSSSAGGSTLSGDPIIIGLVADTTGAGAGYNAIGIDAFNAAITTINADGGVLGRPVELRIENDEGDGTKTPSLATKLIEDGAVALLFTSGGAQASQAKPIINEAKIPSIAPLVTGELFGYGDDKDYAFQVAPPERQRVEVFCDAAKELGYETVAIIRDDSAAMVAAAPVQDDVIGSCLDVVDNELVPTASTDVTAQVARIAAAKPDVVAVISVGGSIEVLFQNALEQALPDTQRFTFGPFSSQSDLFKLVNPGALDGVVYIGNVDSSNPDTVALQDTLREALGESDYAVSTFSAQAWSGINLLANAIETAGSTDGEAVRDALQSTTDFPSTFGQTGFTLSYTADRHVAADGICAFVLLEFDSSNALGGNWDEYQPRCS